MNLGKCPACKRTVQKALIELIEPDTQNSKIFGGVPVGLSFVCPHPDCHTILGVVENKAKA